MNSTDLVTILGNLSQSLNPVQHLITGGAYLLGLLFVFTAITKFRIIANHSTSSPSKEHMYAPIMHLFIGAALIFLPSALSIMANTAFGTGNVLSYAPPKKLDIYTSMGILIRTAGLVWFIRGCVLIVHASEPGTKEGPKGLVFLVAGVLAMNMDNTVAVVNYIISSLVQISLTIKNSQGF